MGIREVSYAVILGVVEGLTEFIPVSSTGHLIVVGHLLRFDGPKAATFEVFIQLGAILAVVFLYKDRFFRLCSLRTTPGFSGRRGLMLLGLTTLPGLAMGAATHRLIKEYLFTPTTVAMGLGIGALGILTIERYRPPVKKAGLDALDHRDAVVVGFCQCFALWPGMSRSACTIVGGMIMNSTITYAVDGKQYVMVFTGGGQSVTAGPLAVVSRSVMPAPVQGHNAIYVFALP